MTHEINPDSMILRQLDGQWQKIAALLLWKFLKRGEAVTFTAAEMEQAFADYAPAGPVVMMNGSGDSISLSLITYDRAKEIAAYERERNKTGVQ